MIVEHWENGFIWHVRSDPDGEDVLASLLANPGTLHVPATPLPSVAVRDADGKLVIEDGKVKRESPGYVEPIITHDYHYVKDGAVVPRPRLPAGDVSIKADGIDAYVLENLPAGSVLRLDGAEVVVDDGTLEFTTDEAGTYVLSAGFPFVDWQVKVTAL